MLGEEEGRTEGREEEEERMTGGGQMVVGEANIIETGAWRASWEVTIAGVANDPPTQSQKLKMKGSAPAPLPILLGAYAVGHRKVLYMRRSQIQNAPGKR